MDGLISRQQAIDALNGIINRFEQILRDIRESKIDDSVCGMCEYDGAYIGQSGDWCNECPGFDKDDCFELSDECRKRWLKSVDLPSAQHTSDVVKVVRCKDCKHWMDIDNGRQRHEMCASFTPEWFCADGERKETEDDKSRMDK